jgi:hypothetical protein
MTSYKTIKRIFTSIPRVELVICTEKHLDLVHFQIYFLFLFTFLALFSAEI